ncbi:hypothetical protein [Mucilaginibacter sp.]|uniref:hypothetical protein n=1 Tax=Mucilaginibacter sp. TaxID=1882438 RepID=UPI0035BBDD03
MNINRTKTILILFASIYALMLVLFVIKNSGIKRSINIEQQTQGGIVVINNVKYGTPYKLERTQITVPVGNPFDYLFLGADDEQDSLSGAAVKIIMTVLIIRLIAQISADNPFRSSYLKQVRIISGLYLLVVILACLRNWYTSNYLLKYLPGSTYKYKETVYSLGWYLSLIILAALYNLYTRAVDNQQELELTV